MDYSDCKCRKKLADKLIDECTETIEKTKLVNIIFTENKNNYECGSCIVYIVLMIVAVTIFNFTVYLVCYNWSLINNNNNNNNICIKFNNRKKNNLMPTII